MRDTREGISFLFDLKDNVNPKMTMNLAAGVNETIPGFTINRHF